MITNIQWQSFKLNESDRAKIKHQQPLSLWMTGLSGAGESTLANALEEKLNGLGKHTYILDGDNLRHGLNQDLGFTVEARYENVRPAPDLARLMVDDYQAEMLQTGSALKLAYLAEGVVDAHPRFVPTMLWDVAAEHCFIEEVGGQVLWADQQLPMTYNIYHMKNDSFIAINKTLQKRVEA